MPIKKLKEFLDENGVKYITVSHSVAYTAQEIAASAHIRGKEVAKTVVLKIDGKLAIDYCEDFLPAIEKRPGGTKANFKKEIILEHLNKE